MSVIKKCIRRSRAESVGLLGANKGSRIYQSLYVGQYSLGDKVDDSGVSFVKSD